MMASWTQPPLSCGLGIARLSATGRGANPHGKQHKMNHERAKRTCTWQSEYSASARELLLDETWGVSAKPLTIALLGLRAAVPEVCARVY